MAKFHKIINNKPPMFLWRVMENKLVHRSGHAKTRIEADAEADIATKELEAENIIE